MTENPPFSRLPANAKYPGPAWVLPEISPSLNGGAIVFEAGDKALNQASDALSYARKCAEAAIATSRAIFNDGTRTLPAQHLAAKEHAYKLTAPGIAMLQKSLDLVNSQIDSLKLALRGPAAQTERLDRRSGRQSDACQNRTGARRL
jgi:hypothetical protein